MLGEHYNWVPPPCVISAFAATTRALTHSHQKIQNAYEKKRQPPHRMPVRAVSRRSLSALAMWNFRFLFTWDEKQVPCPHWLFVLVVCVFRAAHAIIPRFVFTFLQALGRFLFLICSPPSSTPCVCGFFPLLVLDAPRVCVYVCSIMLCVCACRLLMFFLSPAWMQRTLNTNVLICQCCVYCNMLWKRSPSYPALSVPLFFPFVQLM